MDDLRERVAAVERALTDGDGDLTALAEGAATADRVADLEATVETLQDDLAEVEAATQALRGYVGNVRSVNESVEQRADAAVAAVESLEARVEAADEAGGHPGPDRRETNRPDSRQDCVCEACGRPTGAEAAADGGEQAARNPGRDPVSTTPRDSRAGEASTTTGESLDGFDPSTESHRVRIESAEGDQRGRPGSADGPGVSSSGFLARVRDLL